MSVDRPSRIKKYLVAGLLVIAPLWVTFIVLQWLIVKFDSITVLLPEAYRPEHLIGFHIPGLGLLAVFILILFTGMLTTNFIGSYLVGVGDRVLNHIPLVRSIYNSVKTLLDTMLKPGGQSFRKVLLIRYPHGSSWTLAFQTGQGLPEIAPHIGADHVSVFVPTTPSPISGYLLFLPKSDVIELSMSVDDALKLIISLGVILPKNHLPPTIK